MPARDAKKAVAAPTMPLPITTRSAREGRSLVRRMARYARTPMHHPLLAAAGHPLPHHRRATAAVPPLRDNGAALDVDAIAPLVAHLEQGGVDGVFCCGTTGEGVLLSY